MPLSSGDKLGPYEIVAQIGAGGMGEVYRARDTRLNRDVAIKFSKEQFSERFEREARAVAALNHANICHLYDICTSSNAPNYLVMELVEGQSPKGPLPIPEVIRIAGQIASALEAAHEKGIVHRDLKPANIKITPDGTVKVLDFGLAKVAGLSSGDNPEESPTLTMSMTEAGMILGTAAYMSPEQARGKPVDKRADIWAFGVIVYELLTGSRMHKGETISDTLASVLREEPDLNKVPVRFRTMLRRCLDKDPKQRLRDIGDAMPLIADEAAVAAPSSRGSARISWALAAVFGLAAIALAMLLFRKKPPEPPALTRFQIHLPEDVRFTAAGTFAVSPDGRHVAFSAASANEKPGIWIQDLDSLQARFLSSTYTGPQPPPFFWSPDSRYVVYSENSPKLKKVDIVSGALQDICDKPGPPIGGDWNKDGIIIFGSNTTGLWKVPATGGTPTALTALDASKHEREHELPSFLPDGKHFIYLRYSSSNPEESGIYAGSIDDPPDKQSKKRILASRFGAQYVPAADGSSGWLVYLREGTLMAQAFDPAKLELTGEATSIAEGVGSVYETGTFSSAASALVYRPTRALRDFQLTWFDRQGKVLGKVGEPAAISHLRLSPDGSRAAYRRIAANLADEDIWIVDLAKETTTRLTFGSSISAFPVWSPNGAEILFASNRDGVWDIFQKPANGASEEKPFLQTKSPKSPQSWSSDGRFLLFTTGEGSGFAKEDIWLLPMTGADRTPIPFQQTRFNETEARFSPDGRFIAYTSDESGRYEVYVREFNTSTGVAGTGKWLISKDGGGAAQWRSDGKELDYGNDYKVMAVSIDTAHGFQSGTPKELFLAPKGSNDPSATADLKRFLIPVPVDSAKQTPQTVNVVLNWTSLMKPK